jgi:hypothetical protein
MPLILSGSVDISGSMTATTIVVSSPGAAGMVSSSAQITELVPLMAYTASLKSVAIVSSSQQIQNYNLFAVTSSANTFYGNQTINGTLGVTIGGSTELNVQQTGVTIGNVVTDTHRVTGSLNVSGSLNISGSMGIGTNTPAALLETRVGVESSATNKVALIAATGNGANDIFRWFDGATQLGVFKNSGRVAFGPSTSPVYKLEVSTASGSERIRVGTLQNNSNTATFEAITSAGISSATSGWIRAVYGGGLAVGSSTYTKTGGDSGDFSNLSAESATTAFTVNGGHTTYSGNTYLGQTTFFRTDVIGAQNYGGSTIRVAGGTGTSAAGIQFGDVSTNTTGARGRIGFLASANNGNPKEFAIIKGVLDSTGANTCNGSLTFHTLNGDNASEASLRMTIDGSGNIGATSGTNIYNASDIRLKQNISSISGSLNSVLLLNPVKFNWIDDFVPFENGKDMLGFIAQEVQTIVPEAVESFAADSIFVGETEIDNPLRVNEKFLIPVLTKAIQEQQAIIDSLIARIETLENN